MDQRKAWGRRTDGKGNLFDELLRMRVSPGRTDSSTAFAGFEVRSHVKERDVRIVTMSPILTCPRNTQKLVAVQNMFEKKMCQHQAAKIFLIKVLIYSLVTSPGQFSLNIGAWFYFACMDLHGIHPLLCSTN